MYDFYAEHSTLVKVLKFEDIEALVCAFHLLQYTDEIDEAYEALKEVIVRHNLVEDYNADVDRTDRLFG